MWKLHEKSAFIEDSMHLFVDYRSFLPAARPAKPVFTSAYCDNSLFSRTYNYTEHGMVRVWPEKFSVVAWTQGRKGRGGAIPSPPHFLVEWHSPCAAILLALPPVLASHSRSWDIFRQFYLNHFCFVIDVHLMFLRRIEIGMGFSDFPFEYLST